MIYQFADCLLDTSRRELRRAGVLCRIEPQVFDLLQFLLQNRNRVVSRDELVQAIWRGRVVSESVLGTRINAARLAIGDNGREQSLVRTLRRAGLRFVGKVSQEQEAQSTDGKSVLSARQILAAQRLPWSIDGMPRIVVLPFRNLTGHAVDDCVAESLTDEIITALSRLGRLSVASATSSFAYKERSIEANRIARELAAQYLLEGSIREADGTLRVAARLIDCTRDEHIWSDRYDCRLTDSFVILDQIVGQVVVRIADRLYAAETVYARLKSPERLSIWQCIVRALSLINTRKKPQVALAEKLLKRAISIDSNCVAAYCLLSYITTLRVHMGWRPRTETLPLSLQIAQRALEIDPEEPWAYLAQGYAMTHKRPDEAIDYLERALWLDPKLAIAHCLIALSSIYIGQPENAFSHADAADTLAGVDLFSRGNVGAPNNARATACFATGRYDEGISIAHRGIRENPGQIPAYRQLVTNCALAGQTKQAAAALQTLRCLDTKVQEWLDESSVVWRSRADFQKYAEAFRIAGSK